MRQMLYFGHFFGKLLQVQTGETITCLLFMFYLHVIQKLNDVYQSGYKQRLFDSLDLASLYL